MKLGISEDESEPKSNRKIELIGRTDQVDKSYVTNLYDQNMKHKMKTVCPKLVFLNAMKPNHRCIGIECIQV